MLAALLVTLAVGVMGLPSASAASSGVASEVTYYNANYGGLFYRSPTTIQAAVYGITQQTGADSSISLTAGPYSQYTDSGFSIYHGTLGDLGSILVQGSGDYGINLWLDVNNDGDFFEWGTSVSGSVYMTGLGGDVYLLGNVQPNPTSNALVVNGSTSFFLQGVSQPPDGYNYTLAQLQQGELSGVTANTNVAIWIGVTGTTSGDTPASATIDSVQFGPPSTVGVTQACSGTAPGTVVTVDGQTFYCGYDAFPTIQGGVDAVAPGGTVDVAAGTYVEQVQIDKALTLTGAGKDQTVIQLPSSSSTVPGALSGHPTVYGIAVTTPASDVTVSNLTVDGNSAANSVNGCSDDLAGIAFENASGTVNTVHLPGWAPQSDVGCGSGQGVQVEAGSGGTAQVTVENTDVTGYGKSGIFAGGSGADLTATNDTVTTSPTADVATNGIEADYGATAVLSGNTVSGNDYTGTVNASDPQADYAAGVLLYGDGASAVTVSDNTLTDNQISVETVATNADVSGNKISQTGSGIPDSIGVYSVPCDTYCSAVGVATGGTSQVTIKDNTISGIPQSYASDSNPTVVSAGIWAGNTSAAGATGSVDATISGNTVIGGYFGIMAAPNSAGSTATIENNQVSGFERTGIDAGSFAVGGDGVTASITGNTVTGPGSGNTDEWSLNGIEIANGATGSIMGNHVTGMIYTGTEATEATGIIVFESSGVEVTGNTLQDNQLGIALQTAGYSADDANWSMTGEVVEQNTIEFDPSYQAPGVPAGESAGTWGIWTASYSDSASVQATIEGNELNGSNSTTGNIASNGIQVGDTSAGGGAGSVSATITGNSITGWSYGIADVGTTGTGATFSSVANYNDLSGNAIAGLANLTGGASGTTASGALDASHNWWGSTSGPRNAQNTYNVASQGVPVSGGVTFVPWLQGAPALGATSGQSFAPVMDGQDGYSSIQAAVDAASPGDTITADAGTYTEGVTIGNKLTLEGAQSGVDARSRSGPESIIAGSGGGPDVTITSDDVSLDGFTLGGPSSQGTAAIVMMGANTGETIENNIILDPGRAVSYNTSDTTFEQNLVNETGTTGDGIQENSGAVSGVTIQDNTFTGGSSNNADITFIGSTAKHNKDIAVTGNTSTEPSTFLALFNTDGASVTGNTVTGATGAAIYIGGGDSGVTVQHNNMIGASGGPAYAVVVANGFGDGASTDVAVNFNSLYGLSVGAGAYTVGNVDAKDNWWGSKSGPAGVTEGAVDATPWIQSLAISPPMVQAQVGAPLQWSASIVDEDGNAITDPAFAATFALSGTAACQNPSPMTPQPFTSATVGFGCTPTAAGDITVTGTVSLDGIPTTLVGTADVVAVPPVILSSGGGSSAPSGTNGNQSGTVTVNGSTTTINVDSGLLTKYLNGQTGTAVTFSSDTTSCNVNIPADAMQSLVQGNDGISVQTPGATYTLPAGSIDVQRLETLLGVSQPSAISLSISVTPASDTDTTDITQGIPNGNIVGAPVTFTVTATANGQTQTIEVFTGAVPRSFALQTTPDPSDTTGIVLVNGVPEHAWTVFSGTTATVYSHTDSTYAIVTNHVSFNDIAGLPQADAINALANKLIIAGMTPTTFDPQGGVTRAQFAALVIRALGLWNLGTTVQFRDVSSGSWAAPVIQSAVAESFIQGYPDGTFRPDAQITNAQMAAIVARVMHYLAISAGPTVVTPSDQASIPAWASQDVALVLSQGIMTTDSSGAFNPDATTTRAQAAQIIWNLMQKAGIE